MKLSLIMILGLSLVLAACATAPAEPVGEPAEPVTVIETVEVEVPGETQIVQAPGYGEILARVQERGRVVCAGRTDLLGFGYFDDAGGNIGFDIDLCRAVAAAVLSKSSL
jgi:ABC-type amino acid transport substrate-binding protein